MNFEENKQKESQTGSLSRLFYEDPVEFRRKSTPRASPVNRTAEKLLGEEVEGKDLSHSDEDLAISVSQFNERNLTDKDLQFEERKIYERKTPVKTIKSSVDKKTRLDDHTKFSKRRRNTKAFMKNLKLPGRESSSLDLHLIEEHEEESKAEKCLRVSLCSFLPNSPIPFFVVITLFLLSIIFGKHFCHF